MHRRGWTLIRSDMLLGRRMHANPGRKTLATQAAAASGPTATAPPVDLQRWAPKGGPWDSPPRRWVVFSDLHFSPRTQDVCLETLRRVHAEAAQRDAGVLFLGDFWHMRGALPVRC